MKKIIVAMCAGLAACNPAQDTLTGSAAEEEAPAESVSEMLRAGKVEACAHPDVKQLWIDKLKSGANELAAGPMNSQNVTQGDLDEAMAEVGEPQLSLFEALEADASVSRMTCSLQLQIGSLENSNRGYTLSPSLEADSDFLLTFPRMVGGLWTQLVRYKASEKASIRVATIEAAGRSQESDQVNLTADESEEFVWPENEAATEADESGSQGNLVL